MCIGSSAGRCGFRYLPEFCQSHCPCLRRERLAAAGCGHHQIITGVARIPAERDLSPQREASAVDAQMDLGRDPTSRTAKSLFRRPLLGPLHDDGRGSPCCRPSGACWVRFPRGLAHPGCPPTAQPRSSGGTGGRPKTTSRIFWAGPAKAHRFFRSRKYHREQDDDSQVSAQSGVERPE